MLCYHLLPHHRHSHWLLPSVIYALLVRWRLYKIKLTRNFSYRWILKIILNLLNFIFILQHINLINKIALDYVSYEKLTCKFNSLHFHSSEHSPCCTFWILKYYFQPGHVLKTPDKNPVEKLGEGRKANQYWNSMIFELALHPLIT